MRTIRKGVQEEIAEGFDWSDRLLSGETIAASSWQVDFGLTGGNAVFDDTTSEIEITGGTVDTSYKVQNEVTTSDGLVYQKSFKVLVAER